MNQLPEPLKGLAAYNQFILYRLIPRNDGKTDKVPVNPHTLKVDDPHNPAIWVDAGTAFEIADQHKLYVAFVFTENDPFFFLDIDDCLTGAGAWSDRALELCNRFSGAAVEVSQSGKGLHIIGTGQAPKPRRCKSITKDFDLYTEGRFIALTGSGAIGDVNSTGHDVELNNIVTLYLHDESTGINEQWTFGPVPEWNGPTDDDELINKILSSNSAGAVFGNRASVQSLWNADAEILGAAYPHDQGTKPFDHSVADAALCQHLAFWTGKDCERIDRLFRRSALCRDKWLDREKYRQSTILRAVANCKQVYGASQVQATEASNVELKAGFQFVSVDQQLEYFKGCVYVRDLHRVFVPDGGLLKPDQFKASYGGYVFPIDSSNEKTTKNPYEVFTESQAIRFPKVQGICFKPELASGAIIEQEGRTLVNTYVPIPIRKIRGNPSPFLNHLKTLLPNKHDQEILLAYMAACVQHVGTKFQWCPLIQGVEGNGKTLFTRCVMYAVGKRYTHMPKAMDIDNKFNGWLLNKIFIGIEDIYVPEHKRELWEVLKPMITGGDGLEIQFKGADQITADICANFIMNSNYKDAVKKTENDRRLSVFYTAQQEFKDLIRDGITGDYFPKLYEWLRGDGYAIVADYLSNYQIPYELNPAGACHRAPETSSTTEAISLSFGPVEQEIQEAIDEGRPGFAAGWISSIALDRLLQQIRAGRAIPHNRRRALLKSLGYDYHPGLKEGRVNTVIPIDDGKPRLYIKHGHISANLTTPGDIAKAYIDAQGAFNQTGAAVFGFNKKG